MKTLLSVICLACAAFAQTPQHQFPQAGDSYVIARGDVVAVSVWKNPDLTNTLPVNAKGMISMPLLNDVQAAGLSPMQLAASIQEKLKKHDIENPGVTVVVVTMHGPFRKGSIQVPGGLPAGTVLPEYRQPPTRDWQDSPGGIIFKG